MSPHLVPWNCLWWGVNTSFILSFYYLMPSRMLKAGEGPSILTEMPFVASQLVSGLREDRTEHLPTVLGLIPTLSLFSKYQRLLSYLRNQWRQKMEMRACSCLLSKSSHQVSWTFAWVSVAGFGPYASQLLYLHSAEYAYSTVPIKQNYIQ